MNFYEYRQNNSGGSFDMDLGILVYIQANNSEEANDIALNNGIYFNGVSTDRDCSCCGDRWYEADSHDVMNKESLYSSIKNTLFGFIEKIAIIFQDGKIITFDENSKNNQDNLDIFLDRTE